MNLLPFSHTTEEALPARAVVRWKDGGPIRILGVVPRKVDKHRVAEVFKLARFYEDVVDVFSDEELAYIDYLYDEKKTRTWMDVVFAIYKGDIA